MAIFNYEEILEMANDDGTLQSQIIRFYQHCIKWQIQQNYQCVSWIKSIVGSASVVKDLTENNTNLKNSISDDVIEKLFLRGTTKAERDMLGKSSSGNSVRSDFSSVTDIANLSKVANWLVSNVYDQKRDEIIEQLKNNDDIGQYVNG